MQSRIREILSKLGFCQKDKKNKSASNEDAHNSEMPTHEVDDKGYTKQPPSNPGVNNHDPWLDFQQSKNHFYSSSNDSDDEASKRKIKVSIKPVSNIFAIIQSTFYRLIKGLHYFKEKCMK